MGAMSESWEKDGEPQHILNTCEVFDPAVNMWTWGPVLPKPMCAVGVVKYYGSVYLLGTVYAIHTQFTWILLGTTVCYSSMCRKCFQTSYA